MVELLYCHFSGCLVGGVATLLFFRVAGYCEVDEAIEIGSCLGTSARPGVAVAARFCSGMKPLVQWQLKDMQQMCCACACTYSQILKWMSASPSRKMFVRMEVLKR